MIPLSPVIELFRQLKGTRDVRRQTAILAEYAGADPLSLVPEDLRARAELDLRIAEYYVMLGEQGSGVSQDAITTQEQLIMNARENAENDARGKLKRDRDMLQKQPATRLDVTQVAVDLLTLGRGWTEHFNLFGDSVKQSLDEHKQALTRELHSFEQRLIETDKEREAAVNRLRQRVETLSAEIRDVDARISENMQQVRSMADRASRVVDERVSAMEHRLQRARVWLAATTSVGLTGIILAAIALMHAG